MEFMLILILLLCRTNERAQLNVSLRYALFLVPSPRFSLSVSGENGEKWLSERAHLPRKHKFNTHNFVLGVYIFFVDCVGPWWAKKNAPFEIFAIFFNYIRLHGNPMLDGQMGCQQIKHLQYDHTQNVGDYDSWAIVTKCEAVLFLLLLTGSLVLGMVCLKLPRNAKLSATVT